ncbi:MAG: LamG-like jellyroll fold domain-containing protein [Phycisphaerae bacterium]
MRRRIEFSSEIKLATARLRRSSRRRAIALITVLVVTAIIATLAATFIASTGTTTAISRNMESHSQARQIAESGIRATLAYINANEAWRSDKSEGAWVTDASLLGGTFSVTVNDGEDENNDGVISNPAEGDGDLEDDEEDIFTITSTATFGGTIHTSRAVVTPEGSPITTRVLFVVEDKTNLTDQEDAKKTLLESWDFQVQLISGGESQAAYNSAIAENDVAYIGEDVSSSQLSLKLFDAPIGVVNEEQVITDDYGFSSSNSCFTSTSIDIIDNTHSITSDFSNGVISILSSASELHRATGTMAGDADTLAKEPSSNNAALVAIDTGGALYGGGNAVARRVHLPWGCNNFDFTKLNDDGKTILKRSLLWASQTPTVDSPILHYDFDEQSGGTLHDREGSVDLSLVNGNGTLTWVTDIQAGTGLYFNQDSQSGTASCKTSSTSTADSFKSLLRNSDAMTVQAFLKAEGVDNSGGRMVTYSRDTGSTTRNFSLMAGYTGSSTNDDLIGRLKNGSGSETEYRQNDSWSMDEFHVLAMTADHGTNSDNVKLYVDGVLVHTSSASGGNFNSWSSEHFLLGNKQQAIDRFEARCSTSRSGTRP